MLRSIFGGCSTSPAPILQPASTPPKNQPLRPNDRDWSQSQSPPKALEKVTEIKPDGTATLLKPDAQNPRLLPHRYHNRYRCLETSYFTSIKITRQTATENLNKEPRNHTLICTLVAYCLFSAEVCKDWSELATLPEKIEEHKNRSEAFFRSAQFYVQQGFALNPLSGLSYYSASTIMEYEGVEITNLAQVERYLGLLLTAQALEPHHKEIEEVLKTVLDFLKRKWNEQGNFVGLDQLATWLNRDHLKILFQSKPELFALANQPAHAPFFKQHPELQNKEAFTKKYPDVATILPEEMTLEGIRQAIARNPFGAQLSLMTDNTAEKELLSNTVGLVVECWNNQRPLAVYLRHEEDAKTMTEYAKTTPPPKGALFNLSTVRMDGYAQPVYVLSLKPAPT